MVQASDPRNKGENKEEDHKNNVHRRGKFLAMFLLWRLKKEKIYGYMLIDELEDLGMNSCKQSTIYTLLWNMEQMGLVKAEEKLVDNRARRVYSITEKGRKRFEDIRKNKIHGVFKEFLKDLAR